MERYAIIGILGIVLISTFFVFYNTPLTGEYTSSYGVGPKLYGGGMKKAYSQNSVAIGKNRAEAQFILRQQEYVYANQDKWDCSFGKEAEQSAYPCVWDENLQKYCCVIYETPED